VISSRSDDASSRERGAENTPKRALRSWPRRLLTVVAVAVLSLYALYVAAINIVYSTPLFAKLVAAGDPEMVFVSYEQAWSIWPGRTHARGLVIRSSDSHVQWILRCETCVFDISMPDLLVKKLHFTWAHGHGISFQLRRRIPAPAATPEYVAALPPVSGFPPIPLPAQEPDDLLEKWNDAYYHLWTIQLDDIHADDVRELWMDSARFEGTVDLVGGFYLKPIRRVAVGPIAATVRNGQVTALGRSVFDSLQGTGTLRIDGFDPRTARAADVVRLLSASTEVHGHTPDLGNVPRSILSPLRVAGAADLRRLHVIIDHGAFAPDTRADVVIPLASVELVRHKLQGALSGHATVANENGAPRLRFAIEGRDAKAWPSGRHDATVDLLRIASFDVRGDGKELGLTDLLGDLHVVGTVPSFDVDELRAVGAYLPAGSPLELLGGRAHGHAGVEAWLDQSRARGEATIETTGTDVRVGAGRLRGDLGADATIDAWRWTDGILEGAKVTVRLPHATMSRHASPSTTLVEARAMALVAEAREIDLNEPLRALHGGIDVTGAELIDHGLLRTMPWSIRRGSRGGLDHGRAVVDAALVVDVLDRHARGTFDLHSKRFGLSLENVTMSATGDAHAAVHDWDLDRGTFVLDEATVAVTGLEARGARDGKRLLAVSAIHAAVSSDRLRTVDPLADLRIDATLAGARTSDPRRIVSLFAPDATVDVRTTNGEARFDASLHARVDQRVARGAASVHAQHIAVGTAALGVGGDVEAAAEVGAWSIDTGTLRSARGHVVFSDLEASLGAVTRDDAAAGSPPADLHAKRIALTARADLFELGHPSLRRVDARLQVEGAVLEDARRLVARGAPSHGPATFAIESGRAQASADVTLEGPAGKASGRALVAFEDAGVRIDQAHFRGDGAVEVRVLGYDPERDVLDLSGSTIALRHVRTTGTKAQTTSWNGDVTFGQSSLRVTEAPYFGGFVQVHADNAKPILAIALQNHLPKFVVGLLGAPDLSGQARVDLGGGVAAVRGAHVRGSDVVIIGDYVTRGPHVRAAAIVAKGPLSAGIKIDDGGTYVRIGRLETWLAREAAAANQLFEAAAPAPPAR
jgi:hypothetical protein